MDDDLAMGLTTDSTRPGRGSPSSNQWRSTGEWAGTAPGARASGRRSKHCEP